MTVAPPDHLGAPALDDVQTAFRAAMSHVAAAVSVVTVLEGGVPHGTTVSAFMSLSMEPPMMLVSLDARSSLLTRVRPGSRLGVNVLADGQGAVAARFATKGGDRFADLAWQVEAGNLPGKAQNTPFDGRALEGVVLGTWKAGRRVFQ